MLKDSLPNEDLSNARHCVSTKDAFPDASEPQSEQADTKHKVRAFLDEIEAISLRHGLWILPNLPGASPAIQPAEGSETGYVACHLSNGRVLFDRARKHEPVSPDVAAQRLRLALVGNGHHHRHLVTRYSPFYDQFIVEHRASQESAWPSVYEGRTVRYVKLKN